MTDIEMIREAEHYIYIGESPARARIRSMLMLNACREPVLVRRLPVLQRHNTWLMTCHSISSTQDDGIIQNQIAKALVERIVRAGREGKKFRVVVLFPEVPGFAGQSEFSTTSATTAMAEAWHSQG